MKEWKEYEKYVLSHFKNLYPNAKIQADVRLKGCISKLDRQIDILIEESVAGIEIRVVVECKYFNRRIDVKTVEDFLGFLRDIKASKGVLITNKGYSAGALNRATFDSHDIELRILDYGDIEHFLSFGCIVYHGPHGAAISCPPGWVMTLGMTPT